jgi:hypothetical protein
VSLFNLPEWIDEVSFEAAAEPGPISCFSGLRRLSGRIFASCAGVVFVAYLVF